MPQRFFNFRPFRSDYRVVDFLRRPDVRNTLILAVVALALWAPRLRGPIDLRYDAGVYYILGTSLAEGKGYRLLNEPGEISALQYPPLVPAIVALEQKLLGTSDPDIVGQWLRWTYFALFLVYSLATYRLARRLLEPGFAFLAALICTLSCDLLFYSDLLQAELPFAAVTVLFALAARSLSDGKEPLGAARFALAALLGTAAFLIRSAGVALLAAWVGEAVIRRQWKQTALRCAVAAIPFFAWQAWVAHVRGSAEYSSPAYAYQRAPYQYYNVSYVENLLLVDSFKPELGRASAWKITKRVIKNSLTMPKCMGESVSTSSTFGRWAIHWVDDKLGRTTKNPIIPWQSAEVPGYIFGVITVAGMILLTIRGHWFVALYICGTLLLICLTPWPQQFQRYLSPLAPFLVLCMAVMLSRAWQWCLGSRITVIRRAGIALIAVLLAVIPMVEVISDSVVLVYRHAPMADGEHNLIYLGPEWVHWAQAAKWIGEHSNPNDVVATSAPHLLYIKTGRRSVLPPMERNRDVAMQMLDSVPVRYVILSQFHFLDIDWRYAEPAIQAHSKSWNLVYTAQDGKTRVFERVH
jgi:hypothetical protein